MNRHIPPTLLSLALLSGNTPAEENWVYLGDYYAHPVRAMAAVSLNLDKLRRRDGYFEIWERLSPLSDIHALPAATQPRQPERLTLWAIRCRSGVMAKITEGAAGSFEPRAEQQRFFLPAPASYGAAVIEATCGEVRRLAGENRPLATESEMANAPRRKLERPPSLLEDSTLESELE